MGGGGGGGRAHTHALYSRGTPTHAPLLPSPPTCNAHASPAHSTTPPPLTFATTGGRGTGVGAMTSWPSYDSSWPSLPRAAETPNNTPCQSSKQGSTATRRPHTKGSSLHDQGTTPPRVVQCAGAVIAVTGEHDGYTATRCAVCRGTHGSDRGHMTGTPPRVVHCAGALMAVKRAT